MLFLLLKSKRESSSQLKNDVISHESQYCPILVLCSKYVKHAVLMVVVWRMIEGTAA